jgi:hypothetical protein
MRRPLLLLCLGFFLGTFAVAAEEGRILKVLPQFLDQAGRNSLSPSLYDRDAYQAHLRQHTNEVSGMRFAIQWKAHAPVPLKLRVELRGIVTGKGPRETALETSVHPAWFSHWASVPFTGDDYKRFGEVTAWRVTLWDGDRLLNEQKSFLW